MGSAGKIVQKKASKKSKQPPERTQSRTEEMQELFQSDMSEKKQKRRSSGTGNRKSTPRIHSKANQGGIETNNKSFSGVANFLGIGPQSFGSISCLCGIDWSLGLTAPPDLRLVLDCDHLLIQCNSTYRNDTGKCLLKRKYYLRAAKLIKGFLSSITALVL
ncbi:hypothetical protein D5086_011627 [Populus alba]|uniref:Uncharacterized protein n=1 Tax=Populus alba TaxID=43335 RepID=A0ACC4CCR8_POPAL